MDATSPSTGELRSLRAALAARPPAVDDAERIDRLRLLEEIKAAAAAAQAAEALELDRSQRHAQAVASVPAKEQGRDVAAQVGLALRMSPWRARRWLGWARILTTELPATLAELAAGRTTEWRAMLVARETAMLTRDDRATVDRALAPRLEGWGDRHVEVEARRMACRLDPAAAANRARNAASDRRVSIRPAPETMCRLTALLPVAQGVAAYAALATAADTTTAGGDERRRGQIMADTLVQRLTGQATAEAIPTELVLLMTDRALLDPAGDGGGEPAVLLGRGGVGSAPMPADMARGLALDGDAPRWIRRLYSDGARLTALESTRREFTAGQRRFLQLRDQTCRTPWCDAPIRHADHVRSWARGGTTSIDNAQGHCASCNYTKEASGWSARVDGDTVVTTTPTGHSWVSRAPDPPGPPEQAPVDAPPLSVVRVPAVALVETATHVAAVVVAALRAPGRDAPAA